MVKSVKGLWRIRLEQPGDLARLIEEGVALNISAAVIHTAHDIRKCLMDGVRELVIFHLSFPKDYCTICKSFVSPSERYIVYEDLWLQGSREMFDVAKGEGRQGCSKG